MGWFIRLFVPLIQECFLLPGDLWSYDKDTKKYTVSPDPHIACHDVREGEDVFMILASDGLWGVVRPQEAVDITTRYEEDQPENQDASAK